MHVAGGNLTRSPGPLMIDITVDRDGQAAAGADAQRRAAGRRAVRQRNDRRGGRRAADAAGEASPTARPRRRDDAAAASSVISSRASHAAGPAARRETAPRRPAWISATAWRTRVHRSPTPAVSARSSTPRRCRWSPARASGSRRAATDAGRCAIAGGDDYELLLAVQPAHRAGRLAAARRHGDAPLTRIGVCTEGPRDRAASRGATALARGRLAGRIPATSDDSSHARPGPALAGRAAPHRTTRRSGPRRPSRSACFSGSRRSSASTRCSAIAVRLSAQLEPRRGAARRLLEPAVDPRPLLRVRDDGRREDDRHTLPPGFKAQLARCSSSRCSTANSGTIGHNSETAAGGRTRWDR